MSSSGSLDTIDISLEEHGESLKEVRRRGSVARERVVVTYGEDGRERNSSGISRFYLTSFKFNDFRM